MKHATVHTYSSIFKLEICPIFLVIIVFTWMHETKLVWRKAKFITYHLLFLLSFSLSLSFFLLPVKFSEFEHIWNIVACVVRIQYCRTVKDVCTFSYNCCIIERHYT